MDAVQLVDTLYKKLAVGDESALDPSLLRQVPLGYELVVYNYPRRNFVVSLQKSESEKCFSSDWM